MDSRTVGMIRRTKGTLCSVVSGSRDVCPPRGSHRGQGSPGLPYCCTSQWTRRPGASARHCVPTAPGRRASGDDDVCASVSTSSKRRLAFRCAPAPDGLPHQPGAVSRKSDRRSADARSSGPRHGRAGDVRRSHGHRGCRDDVQARGLLFEPEQIFDTTAERLARRRHQGGGQIETRLDAADGLPCHPARLASSCWFRPRFRRSAFRLLWR